MISTRAIVGMMEGRRIQGGLGAYEPKPAKGLLVEPPLPPGRSLRVRLNPKTEILLTPSKGRTADEKFSDIKRKNPGVEIISKIWVCPKRFPQGKHVKM